jgi:HSP20 family protein
MLGELQPWFSAWPSVERFRRDIDELFTRFFGEGYYTPSQSMWRWPAGVDSYFKDGNWVMRFDLPGVEPKDIDVSVAGDTLTVRAIRGHAGDRENGGVGNNYRRFEHSLTLPQGVLRDQIKANYQHGVLELTMPVSPEVMGRKIPVEIGGEGHTQLEHKAA